MTTSSEQVEFLYQKLRAEAEEYGYYLNPDTKFTKELVEGLIINENRYGYRSCPCRLATGKKEEDLDIICPCDYRDADVAEYDTCYCGLYVSQAAAMGKVKINPIPERRPANRAVKQEDIGAGNSALQSLPFPVWRCSVCGYLCARERPPEICPICKATRERFARFM